MSTYEVTCGPSIVSKVVEAGSHIEAFGAAVEGTEADLAHVAKVQDVTTRRSRPRYFSTHVLLQSLGIDFQEAES